MLIGKSLGESFYNAEAMFRIAISENWKHPLTRLISDLNSVLKAEDISFDYSDFRLIKLFWNWKLNAENTLWPGWVRIWLLFWKLKTSSYLPDSRFHYCSESWKHPLARLISYQIWMKPETSLSQPLWFVDCNAVLRQRTQCSDFCCFESWLNPLTFLRWGWSKSSAVNSCTVELKSTLVHTELSLYICLSVHPTLYLLVHSNI